MRRRDKITPAVSEVLKTALNRPLALWFLNDTFEADAVRRQIAAFKQMGWGGFMMHWISGSEPYMGRAWLDGIEHVVQEAAQAGLQAWLYDEAWCPSCYGGGRILAQRPDLQMHTLWHGMQDVSPESSPPLRFDRMRIIHACALPLRDGVPDPAGAVDLTERLGTVAVFPDRPYRHDWGYFPHAKPSLHWRVDEGGQKWELKWTPPSGNWRMYAFCARGTLQWDGFDRLDVLRPEGIEAFLKETHDVYAARLGKYFGTTVPGVMTDEPKFHVPAWTDALPAEYASRVGRDLLADLPALVDPSIPGQAAVRVAFHRVVSDLFRENYLMPMRAWCDRHGLVLLGHISPEEDLTIEVDYTGSIPRLLESLHIPGTDLIQQCVGDAERPVLNLGPRLASTVARQQGIDKVFVEVGGCCEEDVSLEELKHFCDWLMVNGVNLFAFHGMSYSLDGMRKFLAGQTYGVQANLWRHVGQLTAYLAGWAGMLTRHRPLREVAVLRPVNAVRALSFPGNPDPARERLDESLLELAWAMLTRHVEFDLLEEDTASTWEIDGAALRVGRAMYRAVAIPANAPVGAETAARLQAWMDKGGRVVNVGAAPGPVRFDAPVEFRPDTTPDVTGAAEWACTTVRPAVRVDGPDAGDVLAAHLRDGDGDERGLLVNLLRRPVTVTAALGEQSARVTLGPWESRLIQADAPFETAEGEMDHAMILEGPWRVEAHEENHLPLTGPVTHLAVADGVEVSRWVFDSSEVEAVLATLRVDGAPIDGGTHRAEAFYCHTNRVMDLRLAPGRHTIELDTTHCPTVLLAGRFAVEADGDGWRLLPEPDEVSAVDRLRAGYPFVRGPIDFTTPFHVEAGQTGAACLTLPGRKGVVAVQVDGRERGVVCWAPDVCELGPLAPGDHELTLSLTGDGIGILRMGAVWAGLTEPPAVSWRKPGFGS